MTRILVTGINGQVGHALMQNLQHLGEVKGLTRSDADFLQPESLREIIRTYRPDVICNPAAYTAVDKAESETEQAFAVNAQAPAVIAEEAKYIGALLIHYSTDYVYNGLKNSPYVENDPTGPINAYGQSKLAGEQAIQNAACDYLILRTAWVYSRRGHNFFNSMLRLMQEREELGIVDDQTGTPTTANFLATTTAAIIEQALVERRQDRFRSGVYHLTGAGSATWYEFACEIKALLERSGFTGLAEIKPISTEQYPTPAKRAAYSVLNCDAISQRYGLTIPDWRGLLNEIELSEFPA